MDSQMRNNMQLKPVGIEHLDQYNELLKYVFQVTSMELFESGYQDGEIMRAKRPILQKADVFGWFNEDDKLVSQLCIYPCQVNIHGRIYNMGGVTGAGTYPEYSNLGLMNTLIKTGLEKMRSNKQWVSYLYPYSIPYYRRKGWELISDHITFELKETQLPKHKDVQGYVERMPVTDPDVITTYNKFALLSHGALIRSELEWDEYWRWENEDERTAAVYYDKAGIPQGYIFYWIADDIFHIKDFIYMNEEARNGLWNFISAHFSMIDKVIGNIFINEPIAFVLEDSEIKEYIEPYYMARIVDVEEFLKNYPFAEQVKPFHFIVSDSVAEWNNGIFGVIQNGDKIEITRTAVGNAVETNIQTLSSMLMSYRQPAYYYKLERIKTDKDTLRMLDDIIPNELPYFSDYF